MRGGRASDNYNDELTAATTTATSVFGLLLYWDLISLPAKTRRDGILLGANDGILALSGMTDPDVKPILYCFCTDKSVHLYELPIFTDGQIICKTRSPDPSNRS
uniref:Uncharacterized protein n=1 Tax=Quercus lobata TaxID=97700 RepID=A0A7N2N2Q5_QUELO